MRNLIRAAVIVLAVGFTTQLQAQFSLGAGLGYGFDIEEAALNIRANYAFTEEWRAAPDFLYYFDGEEGISIYEINLNGHYVYVDDDGFRSYALGGLNILAISIEDFDGDSEVGLNLGNGVEYDFTDSIAGFAELRFAIQDESQLVLSLGAMFRLGD